MKNENSSYNKLIICCPIKAQVGLGLEYQRNVECNRLSDFEDLLLSNSSFLFTKPMGFTGLLMAWKFKKQLVGNLEGFMFLV